MDCNDDTPNDKKGLSKVRSFNIPLKSTKESGKRKSFNVNEEIKSLDLALGRLKKSKLVNGECRQAALCTPAASGMFMDLCNSSEHFSQNMNTSSLISMNFSHYELLRNLSHCNCDSDGNFSGNTCNVSNSELKDEHLERYFRSIELWSRNFRENSQSTMPYDPSDKSYN